MRECRFRENVDAYAKLSKEQRREFFGKWVIVDAGTLIPIGFDRRYQASDHYVKFPQGENPFIVCVGFEEMTDEEYCRIVGDSRGLQDLYGVQQ